MHERRADDHMIGVRFCGARPIGYIWRSRRERPGASGAGRSPGRSTRPRHRRCGRNMAVPKGGGFQDHRHSPSFRLEIARIRAVPRSSAHRAATCHRTCHPLPGRFRSMLIPLRRRRPGRAANGCENSNGGDFYVCARSWRAIGSRELHLPVTVMVAVSPLISIVVPKGFDAFERRSRM